MNDPLNPFLRRLTESTAHKTIDTFFFFQSPMFKFFYIHYCLKNMHQRGLFNTREEISSCGWWVTVCEENEEFGIICWAVRF